METITGEMLYDVRFREGGFTREQAATLCGVSVRTYRRWERGRARVPVSAYRLLRIVAGGHLPRNAGKNWKGWRFHDGRLWSPEGDSFRAGDVRALPYLLAALAAYEQDARARPKADKTEKKGVVVQLRIVR